MPLIHKSSALISATGCTVVSFSVILLFIECVIFFKSIEQLLVCDFLFLFGMPQSVLNLCYLLNYYYYYTIAILMCITHNLQTNRMFPNNARLLNNNNNNNIYKTSIQPPPNNNNYDDSDDLPQEQNTGLYCEHQRKELIMISGERLRVILRRPSKFRSCGSWAVPHTHTDIDGKKHSKIPNHPSVWFPLPSDILYDLHDVLLSYSRWRSFPAFDFWALLRIPLAMLRC